MPATAAAPRVLSVGELATAIRAALDRQVGRVWVAGEISGWKQAASGHCYFTLKDDEAQVSAVLFRRDAERLAFPPGDGLAVVVRARVDLYAPRGALQLYVDALEPLGAGALRAAFDRLKATLEAEGLFATDRKRPLPAFPRVVGIVTALTGAAVHDMRVVLARRWPLARLVIRPARVQGEGAADDIAEGIADLEATGDVEVMLVGRGGGSLEDLWAFNTERVARAIAGSRIPVVAAVGHEVDVTIADYVADARAATPTAGAALVVPDQVVVRATLVDLERRMVSAIQALVDRRRTAWARAAATLGDPRRGLRPLRVRLDDAVARAATALGRSVAGRRRELTGLVDRVPRAVQQHTRTARLTLGRTHAMLGALSPLACLDRGYAIVQHVGDQRIIRDVTTVAAGDTVTVRVARGRFRARVDETQEE